MSPTPNKTETCNIASALVRQAELQGQSTAIHYPVGKRGKRIAYESVSYSELDELSDQYARGLVEYGIGRGIRSALMLTPGLDFFAMFFALFKAGAIPVLIDPGIGIKPLKTCLAEARPEAFIGVTKAQVARSLLGWAPGAKLVTSGPKLGWGGLNTRQLRKLGQKSSGSMLADTQADEMAALLFTSGSTGIPKGVVYRHRHFIAQVEMLKSAFDIQPGEVDLPTFPPFALFDPAMGMTTVVPLMDPTQPAKADPRMLIQTIEHFGVTNIFGSPALLNVLGRYTESENISLPGVRRIISAGAAMPIATILRLQKSLSNHAEVYTPYGATECLPVTSVSGTELDAKVERLTAIGEGTCVGRPVAPNNVKIIGITDNVVERFEDSVEMPVGIIGEIVVNGPTSTDTYWQQTKQTQLAKVTDSEGKIWHRMGDVGYFDTEGRLWYCGRKSQRVDTGLECFYADQVEAIFNVHPEVARTALVGIGNPGQQTPVLCVEPLLKPNTRRKDRIEHDLLQLGQRRAVSRSIQKVLFHKSFPVDIRHNAKIGREKLAAWAEKMLA
ncbi:MAG: fatty acid CoA ligase family protein [Xanthomonadales bacterium]|nr:fatty acid CoA ligase family protein [Xanthomonadales bacterium]